jgi:flavorubredoxin
MGRVLIVYSSLSGNTKEMAKAVAEGAKSGGASAVVMKKASNAIADDLMTCDTVAFGSPTTFGYISGALKDFFDRTLMQCQNKVNDKPYVTFTSSGTGKKKALEILDEIASAYKLKKVCEGVMANGKPTDDDLAQCKELGRKLAGC